MSELRELASFRVTRGLAVSLYLGFDPAVTATGDEVETRVASLVEEARREAGTLVERLGHAERLAFEEDLERLRRHGGVGLGPGSVAYFADRADGLWQRLERSARLPDAVRVGSSLYLVPLVAAAVDEEALVAEVGRERGRIHRLRSGRLVEVADLSEGQPRRHHKGELWRQSKLQGHVDELARAHLRRVADELDALVGGGGAGSLVLAGEQEHTAAVAGMLSPGARQALAGVVHPDAHARPAELVGLVLPVLEQRRSAEEGVVVERWRAAVARGEGAVAGWSDTLAAASDGRVALLLFRERAAQPGYECPGCGRVSADPGACPLDGRALERRPDALDLAVHQTLVNGGETLLVRDHRDLDPVGGIGALLR